MKHILLIEDNEDLRENTAEILELSNYKVSTAPDGKTGIEIALQNKPDLVLCDVLMPVLNGYDVLHILNEHTELTGIPFIFLTAKSEKIDYRQAMEMGANAYVIKPFTESELLDTITRQLNDR